MLVATPAMVVVKISFRFTQTTNLWLQKSKPTKIANRTDLEGPRIKIYSTVVTRYIYKHNIHYTINKKSHGMPRA